jgi:hypothetical protein
MMQLNSPSTQDFSFWVQPAVVHGSWLMSRVDWQRAPWLLFVGAVNNSVPAELTAVPAPPTDSVSETLVSPPAQTGEPLIDWA